MHTALMVRLSTFVYGLLLTGLPGLCSLLIAQEPTPKIDPNVSGKWVEMPKDGLPWKHQGTDLQFPVQLGDFTLKAGFQDMS